MHKHISLVSVPRLAIVPEQDNLQYLILQIPDLICDITSSVLAWIKYMTKN